MKKRRLKKEEVSRLHLDEYNFGRRSLGIYSQSFCRVFAYAVLHFEKYCTSLVLRSGDFHSVSIIEMKISF